MSVLDRFWKWDKRSLNLHLAIMWCRQSGVRDRACMIKLVNTTPRFSADCSGFTLYFSTMSNRETFTAHPERFVPQYAGYCAWGVARGYKAAIDPESFTIGKLYLNYSPPVFVSWRKDIPGYLRQADHNWPEVARQPKVHQ